MTSTRFTFISLRTGALKPRIDTLRGSSAFDFLWVRFLCVEPSSEAQIQGAERLALNAGLPYCFMLVWMS